MENKPWHIMAVSEQIKARAEEGFERRMEMGVKELSHPVEQNPTAGERGVDREMFFGALETMRKHYSPEEIRGFVETHFRLENYEDLRFNFVREVQPLIRNLLEVKQAYYIDKNSDLLEEGLEVWGEEAQIAAKDSLELGYMAEDLYDDILEILEDRV